MQEPVQNDRATFVLKEIKMIRGCFAVTLLFLFTLALYVPAASTQQSEYPVMDKVAQKVIDKYQTSSCEDLKAKKEQAPDPKQDAMKQRVVGMLKSDPKMREQFLNKVAAPIANKMFECGMIP
jgi:hypothetical protein